MFSAAPFPPGVWWKWTPAVAAISANRKRVAGPAAPGWRLCLQPARDSPVRRSAAVRRAGDALMVAEAPMLRWLVDFDKCTGYPMGLIATGRKGAVKVFQSLTERKLRKKANGW